MELMMNNQGIFEEYDDTYDVVIHCDSKEARDEVLADLKAVNDRLDVLDKIRAEIKGWQVDIHDNENDADKHDYVFERIFEIIDEYKAESEDKE